MSSAAEAAFAEGQANELPAFAPDQSAPKPEGAEKPSKKLSAAEAAFAEGQGIAPEQEEISFAEKLKTTPYEKLSKLQQDRLTTFTTPEEIAQIPKHIPKTDEQLRTQFEHERSLPWNEGMRTPEDWYNIGKEVIGTGVKFAKGAKKYAEESLFSEADKDPSGWGHPSIQPTKDLVSSAVQLPEDVAYFGTKLAEGGTDWTDRLSEKFGLHDKEKSFENYKARYMVDMAHAQTLQETPSVYGRVLKNEMANKALSSVILNSLPDTKTIMEQDGITEEQAKAKRQSMADQIAQQTTSQAAAEEKAADEDIALTGSFIMPAGLGLGEMGAVGLAAETAMGLTPKIAQGLKYLGKTDAEIKAMNDAAQALQKQKFAEKLEKRQQPSMVGRTAGAIAEGVDKLKALGEAAPEGLKKVLPVGVGAIAGYETDKEHPLFGALVGGAVGHGAAPLLKLGAYAAKAPALIRDIDEARAIAAGGSKGTFETLGSLPDVSESTAKILRFGGKNLDSIINNSVEYAKAGIHPTLIALGTGALDSASPEERNQMLSTGLLYGVGGRALHHVLGKITGVDPVVEQRERQQQAVDDYKTYKSLDPETQKTMNGLTSWDNVIKRHEKMVSEAYAAYNDAVRSGSKDAEKLGKALNEEKKTLSAVTRANVQTRNEFSRQFLTQLTKLNELTNGTLRAGQNNVGVHILTPDQIFAKFRQDPANNGMTDAEVMETANQQGFYSTPEGAVEYQAGMPMGGEKKPLIFDRTKPSIVINANHLKARQQIFGETPIEALTHEFGHHIRNIPEFREANKDAEDLLFSQEIKDLNGNVTATTSGKYSTKDLVDMYQNNYMRGKSPEQFEQLSKLAGLWDETRGALNEQAVATYMKDEIIAQLNAGTLSNHLGKDLDSATLHLMDLATIKTKKNLLDKAVQKFFGLGGKGSPVDPLTGAEFSPEVLAANRQAIRALQALQGEVSPAVKAPDAPKISRALMIKNRAIMEKYGKYSGLFKTKMQGQVYDAAGNPVGAPVDITNPAAAEGAWATDRQLSGYGQKPDEVQGMAIPDGGKLVVSKAFVTEADGVTPAMYTPAEAKKLQKARKDTIMQALNTPDEGTPNRFQPVADNSETWRGTFTPLQIQAIKDLPEGIIPKSIKDHILKINDAIVRGDGSRMLVDYAAVMNDAGKYTAYSPKVYDVVPIGMHLSKDGNFLVTTISVGRMFEKLNAWSQRMPARLSPWGGDKNAFFKEFTEKYLQNWQNGLAGETGLAGTPAEALAKKNIFNDFLNLTTNDFRGLNEDRTRTPRRRGDVRGKDIDRTIMSMRLDHMAELMDNEHAPKVPVDYGKAIRNFMPDVAVVPERYTGTGSEGEERRGKYVATTGIQFMPASAEIREEGTPQHLEFWNRELENSGIKDKPATMAALDKWIHSHVKEKYSLLQTNFRQPVEKQTLFPKIDPEKIKNYYQKVVRNATPAQAADFPPDWLRIRNMSQEEFNRSFDQDKVDQITQFRVNALANSVNYLLGEMKESSRQPEYSVQYQSGEYGGFAVLKDGKVEEIHPSLQSAERAIEREQIQGSYTPAEVAAILNASSKFRINAGYNEEGEMVPLIQNISNGNEAVPNEVSGATASKIAEYMRQGMSSKDAYTKGVFDVIKARAEKRGVYTGWKKYDQSSDMGQAEKLNADCAGTGWCTGGSVGTANSHLTGGDFYLYFDEGSPQIAIRTENGEIAEVRGTGKAQNITAPQYDAEAEKFILGGEGPTGGDKYLHDRNFRKMAVEIIKTGVLPVDAYKYYDQNGVFYPPSPKQRDYGNGFEQEYLQPFIDNAPKTEDILDKNGNLLTGLVWTPEDPNNNKYKNVSGKIMVRVDKRNGETFELPYLESAGEILTANITNVYLPNLKKVGAIGGDSAGEVNLPLLKESGNVWFYYANKINLPQLETASRIHISHANDLIVPKLKTAKSIEFGSQTRMADNKNVDFSSLEKVTTLDIRGPSQVAVPKLEKVKNIDLSLVTAFIAPKLESIDTAYFGNTKIVYAPEVSIRLMYSVKGINEFIGRRSTLLDIVREWKRANPADLSDDPFYYTDPEGNKYNFANQRDFKNIFDVIDGKEVPSKITEPYAGTNEKIVSAVITTPQGKVEKEGATHLELQGPNAPKDPFDREGKWWKFRTYNPHGAPRVVDRREAFSIAEQNGQLKKPETLEDQVNYDRGVLHSDMVNYARDGDTGIQFMPADEEYTNEQKTRNDLVRKYDDLIKSQSSKGSSVVYHQPPEKDAEGDVISNELWVVSSPKNERESIITKNDDGLFDVSKGEDGMFYDHKTLEDAMSQARHYVESAPSSDQHNLQRDARSEIMEEIHIPSDMLLKEVRDTANDSIYYRVDHILTRDEEGDPDDVETYKISIRNHDPSPFRELEFGKNDYWVEVPKNPSPKDMADAVSKVEKWLENQSNINFMPSSELPKTEDGKVDWESFKTKTLETAKPLANLAPLGGISFKPAQEIELDKPDAVQKAGVSTKLPKNVPASGHYTIAMQPTDDGREVQYQVDPKSTITPKVGSIEDIDGEQVGMLEADRHTTRGDNMGGPLHPFLISNQVIARLLDGRGFKPVWANMNSAFVTRAKNIITNTTSGRALIQIMKEQAHKSNRKFVQDIMQEIDSTKKNLSADEKDALHVILELGAKNPAKHLARVTKAAKLLKDGEITQGEFELIKSQNADKIEKYGPQVDFLKKLGTMKSMATKGNRAGFDNAFKAHNDQFKNQDWYKKIVNKYKNTTFQDEASRFTFVERGSAMSRLDGIPFAPPIGKRLAESMDFRGGKNLDLVASVQLSKDPDAFAIYTGNDPKQEAKMSENERFLRDQFMKDPNFRKHPSYDWMMLGPENADNFILEKPVDPMSLFPDYAKNHPKESVRNGTKETIVGTMKKSKIPLIINTKK